MNTRLPGFGAAHSLVASHTAYRLAAHPAPHVDAGYTVIPAQDSRQECVNTCMSDCLANQGTYRTCARSCEIECGPPPRGPGGSGGCTPVDNSVNRNLCLAAITAWEIAAGVDCAGIAIAAGPAFGPFIAAACRAGIPPLSNQMRGDCPPATLCI